MNHNISYKNSLNFVTLFKFLSNLYINSLTVVMEYKISLYHKTKSISQDIEISSKICLSIVHKTLYNYNIIYQSTLNMFHLVFCTGRN